MKLSYIALAASLVMSTAAQAEDIVVTARKTEENLKETPVSVRYFSEEQLERANITKIADLPSIGQRIATPHSSALTMSIHGQAQQDPVITVDNAVGVYVDGVYVARSYGLNSYLLDVNNIQVLNGPQGTLFGRGSTGGAVLINTNDPKLNTVEGKVELGYGNHDEREGSAVINLPIGDKVAFRGAISRRKSDGYVKDTVTHDKYNNDNGLLVRGKLLVAPTDGINTVVTGEFYDSETNPNARHLIYGWGTNAAVAQPNLVDYTTTTVTPYNHTKYGSVSATTNIGKLKVVGGWRHVKSDQVLDFDGSSLALTTGYNNADIQQHTVEATYNDQLGKINYILGGFYFNESGNDNLNSYLNNRTSNVSWNAYGHNKSYGTFAHVEVPLTERLSVDGGIRYTHDNKQATTRNMLISATGVKTACVLSGLNLADNCVVSYGKSFDKVSWTAGVNYKLADNLYTYAKVSTGYKSGGLQAKAVSTVSAGTFNPENIIEYSAGVKGNLGPVDYAINGFYNKITDMQVGAVYVQPVFTTVLRNAAEARVYGGEATIGVQIADNFKVNFNGILANPKYLNYKNPITGAELADSNFNLVVKKQFTVDGTYTLGNVDLSANYVWTDRIAQAFNSLASIQATFGNTLGAQIYDTIRTKQAGIVNLRATAHINNVDVSVWGKNVLNHRYYNYLFYSPGSYISGATNDPVGYGVTVGAKF